MTGGYSVGGDANDNTLIVTGGTMGDLLNGHSLYGGYADAGSANGNIVSVAGSTTTPFTFFDNNYIVFGGYADTVGSAMDNQVTVGGTAAATNVGGVYGGVVQTGNGAATGNQVTVTGGTIGSWGIMGGITDTGAASDNIVQVGGGASLALNGSIWGGRSYGTGETSGNRVTVSDASSPTRNIIGGESFNSSANDNLVDVTLGAGQSFATVYGGVSYSATATDSAAGNQVAISGSGVVGEVYGGWATDAASADRNVVSLAGTTATGIVVGGSSSSGNASGNSVTVHSGVLDSQLIGGVTYNSGSVANDNTITILGGSINGDVTAGSAGFVGTSIGNTVNVFGGVFDPSVNIYGGANPTVFTGNTLNTRNVIGATVASIQNFENYNFTVGSADVGKTVYTVTTPVLLGGSNVSVVLGGNDPLKPGDFINLFSRTDGTAPLTGTVLSQNGSLFEYDTYIEINPLSGNDELRVVVAGTRATSDTQLFGQSQLAGLEMLNVASDFARSIAGMMGQIGCTPCFAPGSRWTTFAGVEGGTSRWNTGDGSRTSLDHLSVVAGLGHRSDNLLVAGYFEGGWGKYDAKYGGIKRVDDEKVDYLGGGLLARYSVGGFYAEAGFHAGRNQTNFAAVFNNLRDSYKAKSAYYGADAILGYRIFAGISNIDLSARYSWNRLKGDDVVFTDNRIELDSIDSHRLITGARWTYAGANAFHPYAGAYFQYEFDGKSGGRVRTATRAYELQQAKTRGASGIGELGVRYCRADSRFTADVGVEGYVGRRGGVVGKAMVGWSF